MLNKISQYFGGVIKVSKKRRKKSIKVSFEKDWRPTIWAVGIISIFTVIIYGIPFSVYFVLKNYFTSYEVDQNVLSINKGIIFKKNDTIDLYQIKNISAQNDIFKGGILLVKMQDKSEFKLPYIKNTTNVLPLIREVSHISRREQHVTSHEVM